MTQRMRDKLRELFSIDIRSLALARIGIATMLLVDLIDRGRYIDEFYTDAGFMPRDVYAQVDASALSYHLLGGSSLYESALFVVAAIFAAMLLVGYKTRVASVISWLLLASLQNRNHLVNFGGDIELERVLFWCLFLPLGACWSVDARRVGEGASAARGAVAYSVASAAALVQVSYTYFFAGLEKSGPAWVSDFDAIYLALHDDFLVTGIGPWFRQFEGLMEVMTPLILGFEFVAILFLFSPFATAQVRCVMVVVIAMFHFGLASMIRLSTFPYMCFVCAWIFLPPLFWDLVDRFRGVPPAPGAALERAVIATPSVALQSGLALVLLYTTVQLTAGAVEGLKVPTPLFTVGHWLQLNHDWGLYSPEPSPYNIRREISGVLADGTRVPDLLVVDTGETWSSVQAIHEAKRFRVYLENWTSPRFQDFNHAYGAWLCRQWNADALANRSLREVSWVAVSQEILPTGGRLGPEVRELLFAHPCETPLDIAPSG